MSFLKRNKQWRKLNWNNKFKTKLTNVQSETETKKLTEIGTMVEAKCQLMLEVYSQTLIKCINIIRLYHLISMFQ